MTTLQASLIAKIRSFVLRTTGVQVGLRDLIMFSSEIVDEINFKTERIEPSSNPLSKAALRRRLDGAYEEFVFNPTPENFKAYEDTHKLWSAAGDKEPFGKEVYERVGNGSIGHGIKQLNMAYDIIVKSQDRLKHMPFTARLIKRYIASGISVLNKLKTQEDRSGEQPSNSHYSVDPDSYGGNTKLDYPMAHAYTELVTEGLRAGMALHEANKKRRERNKAIADAVQKAHDDFNWSPEGAMNAHLAKAADLQESINKNWLEIKTILAKAEDEVFVQGMIELGYQYIMVDGNRVWTKVDLTKKIPYEQGEDKEEREKKKEHNKKVTWLDRLRRCADKKGASEFGGDTLEG
jgi:hypothetical protein